MLNADDATCALEISDMVFGSVDKFSFAQVKDLATDIIEECSTSNGKPGYGGQWHIGAQSLWRVRVFGVRDDEDLSRNGTGLSGDDSSNSTHVSPMVEPFGEANTTLVNNPIPMLAIGQTS